MAVDQTKDFGEPFERIDVDQAKAMIDRGAVQIVDVRQPREFEQGHLPGAVLIPLDKLLLRSGELSQSETLLFVCAVGERSAVASEIAATVGRTKIFNLEGGVAAWGKRGYPLVK